MKKKGQDLNIRSFEEVYETSYSHGLESIYRLENVDIKSVRKMGEAAQERETKPLVEPSKKAFKPSWDSEKLDLGPKICGYLKAFVVQEPLQILKLSKHTEKSLLEQGHRFIGHLIGSDLQHLVFVKGLGQGHLEEIKSRLKEYIGAKPIDRSYTLDFGSWIRSICGFLEPKMAVCLLEPWHLAYLIPLTPLESLEIRKMTLEKKQELAEQAQKKLTNPEIVSQVRLRVEEIEGVFITPWIENRGGAATREEIYERLERISDEPAISLKAFKFLTKFFIAKPDIFNLPQEDGIYFSSKESWGRFNEMETRLLSYLWGSEVQVELKDLYRWITRDLLAKWDQVDLKFLKKVIFLSNKLMSIKGKEGSLLIKRRNLYIRP